MISTFSGYLCEPLFSRQLRETSDYKTKDTLKVFPVEKTIKKIKFSLFSLL